MGKCSDCKYLRFEEDADEDVRDGQRCYTNYSSWYECDYNQKHFDEKKLKEENECKRFKEYK